MGGEDPYYGGRNHPLPIFNFHMNTGMVANGLKHIDMNCMISTSLYVCLSGTVVGLLD